jgi:hypothetical protein
MGTAQRGLLAGRFAGLVLAILDFVTDGSPGSPLPAVLHWFGISIQDSTASHFGGFFLLIALGGVFGLVFDIVVRGTTIPAGRALLWGMALGVIWWLIFSLVLANIMNHAPSPFSLTFGGFLATFPLDILFGILLGTTYSRLQEWHLASEQP